MRTSIASVYFKDTPDDYAVRMTCCRVSASLRNGKSAFTASATRLAR